MTLGICWEILLRLPAESLFRFRAVCKGWRALIDDPGFVKAHTNNSQQRLSSTLLVRNSTGHPFHPFYSFNLDDFNFTNNGTKTIPATPLKLSRSELSSRLKVLPLATCNGLILIAPISHENIGHNDEIEIGWDREGTWEIWNPLTHERLELPKLDIDSHLGLTAWGLGYDCATDDYKAVVISYKFDGKPPFQEKKEHQTHVYSLKSDSWRRIGNCPCDGWRNVGCGAFLNGVLYWITRDTYPTDTIIVALDLGTEKYRLLEHPTLPFSYFSKKADHRKQIDVLGGRLIVSEYFHDDCTRVFVLSVMKENRAFYFWVKFFPIHKYNIDNQYHIRPVAYMKNGTQILVHTGLHELYLFDVKSESGKKVNIHGESGKKVRIHGLTGDLFAQVVPKSIFRIHDNCGVTGGRRIFSDSNEVSFSCRLTVSVRNDDESLNSW